jgi:uncharacterized membrane protein (UPF0127 family)
MIIRILFLLFATILVEAKPEKIKVTVENVKLELFIADTDSSRARGLMGVDYLGENEGMIFFWPSTSKKCMWMKNTNLPLSVAFIDQDRTIVQINDLQPLSTESVCSRSERIIAAIEMNKDWFEENGLKEGSQVNLN